MATTHVRAVAVAAESLFASIAGTTGLPSNGTLSFARLEFERASISFDGQSQAANEREDGRASAYHLPPEPVTMFSGTDRVRARSGTINIRCKVRTIGAATPNYSAYTDIPLNRIIESGCGAYVPGVTSDTVSASSATANNTRWTPTAIASFPEAGIGSGVAVDIDGRKEFAMVTDRVDAGTDLVYVSPGFTTDLSNEVVWRCVTYYPALGTSTLGASVCLRVAGDGWLYYAYGCRWSSMTYSLENGCLYVEFAIMAPVIQDDHSAYAAALLNPLRADGRIAHARGSYVRITGSIGTSSPAELAGVNYGAETWSYTWTNTLSPLSHSDDLAGMSDLAVTNVTVTATVTLSVPSSTFDAYFLNQTEVTVLLGCGPTGQGNGWCGAIMAAHLTSDPSVRDLSGDTVKQILNFRQGEWTLDDATAAPADTHARILFPLQSA